MPPPQKPGRSRQDYKTPQNFIEAVKRRLGIRAFAIDLAAHAGNAQASTWFGPGSQIYTDAFVAPNWARYCRHGWAWLNPPFSDIDPWAKRCMEARSEGGHIAFLVPASIGSDWYRDYVDGHARVLALNGRLAFIEGKPDDLYPKDCVLALFSPQVEPGFEVWSWRQLLRGKVAA